MSWAAKLLQPPKPEERLKALADYYKSLSPSKILSEALGCYTPMLLGTPLEARPLVEHTMVICVDTESYTMNTDQMTELGLVYISRKTAKGIGLPGPHGWKLQEALKFHHFRVVEHAHLKSNRLDSKGPLGNRFGNTTFTTFAELRLILDNLFNQAIETDDPELKGCKRPVILVGHALRHDTENTNKQGLEYNLEDNITLVAKVDTQALARETKVWIPPVGMETNEIGLKVMIENLGFKHVDDHTACNDAARTMMCAIHMVLPDGLRKSANPTMQAVVDRVEARSKVTSSARYGTTQCCIRCGARDHCADKCQTRVWCAACDRYVQGDGRAAIVNSHIETYCQRVAKFKAWLRRYRDAKLKGRPLSSEVAAGPGPDAHPWSTWPRSTVCAYPFAELNDALVGLDLIKYNPHNREPAAFVHNLEAALGGIPAPSTGNWVPASSNMALPVSSSMPLAALPSLPFGRATGSSSNSARRSLSGAPVWPATSSPLPASTSTAVPVAAREVMMSAARGRGRSERGRESTCGGRGRGGPCGRHGDGGASAGGGGAGAEGWNPSSVW